MAAGKDPVNKAEGYMIPVTTGSVAEFYIEPMLPHVGDIDVMYHLSTELAIPRRQSPPTQLPAKFHSYVDVYEIIDSLDLPGYVYLNVCYLLTECDDEGKYNAVNYNMLCLLQNRFALDHDIVHGPAVLCIEPDTGLLPCDAVHCVRCLSWPLQAAGWPTRHRNYDWPDSATVDRVVNSGCDMVPVAHRRCRRYDQHQWWMSFSRAEIVLLNSWMPVQQIMYHMLRVFVKAERLTDSADNSGAGKLSNVTITLKL